ncbi:MAG: hypothetical protein HUK21_10370 [Fibrobacteraceae bacterium]|nr:hypothetical protein [Fibrobacteraceae bacterium]
MGEKSLALKGAGDFFWGGASAKVRFFLYHIECSTKNIGYGLFLPHPSNIIIAAEKIGDNVQINQNVTIGGNMGKYNYYSDGIVQKMPIIGNRVIICPNAIVGGGD